MVPVQCIVKVVLLGNGPRQSLINYHFHILIFMLEIQLNNVAKFEVTAVDLVRG